MYPEVCTSAGSLYPCRSGTGSVVVLSLHPPGSPLAIFGVCIARASVKRHIIITRHPRRCRRVPPKGSHRPGNAPWRTKSRRQNQILLFPKTDYRCPCRNNQTAQWMPGIMALRLPNEGTRQSTAAAVMPRPARR